MLRPFFLKTQVGVNGFLSGSWVFEDKIKCRRGKQRGFEEEKMESKRFRLVLSYDGTDFFGSQRQAEGRTVQSELERASALLHGQRIPIHFAGRTDRGVHALGMVAAYTVATDLDEAVIGRALNARLPRDLRVMECTQVDLGFHPRFDARSKLYRYRLWVGRELPPLVRRTTWRVRWKLDTEQMDRACELLIGEKDFAAFMAAGSNVRSTIRRMEVARLSRNGHLWELDFQGNGFLRHQVRTLVGTLLDVGRGWTSVDHFACLLQGGSRSGAGRTAPAHGLTLVRVAY